MALVKLENVSRNARNNTLAKDVVERTNSFASHAVFAFFFLKKWRANFQKRPGEKRGKTFELQLFRL